MSWMGEFEDPLFSGNLLATLVPLFMQWGERNALASDPNLLAAVNNEIGRYNQNRGYDAQTGRFGAGNPLGDPASGYGGAFGQDGQGNPYSPVQGFARYGLGQINNSQNILDQYTQNMGLVAGGAGIPAPSRLDLGTNALGLQPERVQGVDQSQRHRPTPLKPVEAPGGFLEQLARGFEEFVGSFAVGTTSVPRDGLAQVHQGEMIVPKAQNPLAQAPGQPGVPMQTVNPQAMGGGAAPAVVPGNNGVASQPGMPPSAGGAAGGTPALPHAGGPPALHSAAGGTPALPQYFGLQPGLSPEVQNAIATRAREGLDAGHAALQRDVRNRGPAGNGAVVDRRLFDSEVARRGQHANIVRDVGIEAANRDFGDRLAANEQLLNRFLGTGQLGLAGRQQALSEELGRGNLALQGELGRGQLGVQQGQLALEGELGRGQLGLGQQAQDLAREYQLGQLGLGQGQLDLSRQVQLGQLGLGQQAQDLAREYQLGQLGLGQGQLDLDRQLGLGQLGLGQGQLALQGELGRGQLALDQELGRNRLDLDRLQIGNEFALGNRGLDVQRDYNEGQLQLGQGELGFRNRAFDAELGRSINNDIFSALMQLSGRNDGLFGGMVQGQYESAEQEQLGQLLSLLSQYAGQTAAA